MNKIKICRIATVPFALFGSFKHIEELKNHDCEVTIVCSKDENFHVIENLDIFKAVDISIKREISPFSDLVSIWHLFKFFRENKFDVIHSNTPKGGLVVSIAGFLARSPIVIHTFTGQRWQTIKGLKGKLLRLCDRIITTLNTRCYADSWSQRNFLIQSGIGSEKKLSCIHKGAFAGVDLKRFDFKKFDDKKLEILSELNFNEKDIIITFVGRIVGDKGIAELVQAFNELKKEYENIKLLLIGPREKGGDPVCGKTLEIVDESDDITNVGLCLVIEKYLSVSDIFALPSYREGFPTVVMEAGAMKVPSVVTDIVGGRDTVLNGVTGEHFKPRSVESLKGALRKLLSDKERRVEMGNNAYDRVLEDFTLEILAKKNTDEYKRLIQIRS